MPEKTSSLLKYAMHYGALLGLFWVFRYLFKIGSGFSDHVFIYLFYLLDVVTMLLIYVFTIKFRSSDPDKPKTMMQCIVFVMGVCFFASFFEAIIMYAHYAFIDPAYFSRLIEPIIPAIDNMRKVFPMSDAEFEEVKRMEISFFTNKMTFVILEFIKNVILGFFLGLIMSFLVRTRRIEK